MPPLYITGDIHLTLSARHRELGFAYGFHFFFIAEPAQHAQHAFGGGLGRLYHQGYYRKAQQVLGF
ncbi:hypothetical protein AB6D66_18860 [Vibrio pomeroyi]|uniref:Uncharacterized protein n=1 Tax=Vibrio pomeroyi TaxID=198832 RepID=A0ABV4N200_9VIBR